MPSVSFSYLLPATASRNAQKNGRLPRAVISAIGLSVTVDIVAVDGQSFDNLAAKWEEVERPGRLPLLEYAGGQLATMQWRVILGVDPDGSIEARLGALREIAVSGGRVFLTRPGAGTPWTLARGGGWALTGFKFRTVLRRFSDNAISRAELDLTFTEMSRLEGS